MRNKIKRKRYLQKYYQENKEALLKKHREYYQKNKERIIMRIKKYHQKNYLKNKEKIDLRRREIYQENYQKNKFKLREYRQKHERKLKANEYVKQRRKNDLLCRLRNSVYLALRNYLKIGKIRSSKKYGIDYKAIIRHLKPFPKNIRNYEIDHIIPLSLFDLNNPEQIKKAFLPSNHQWLTKEQNLRKGNKLVVPLASCN